MELQNDEYFESKYYTFNFRFFKLIGIWRYDISPKQLIYICILNFMIAVGSLSQIYSLFTSEPKVAPIIKLMETTVPSLCFAMCYYNILSNTTTMKRILHHIKCDWDNMAYKPELIILKEYANRTRTYTITIAIAFYLYIISLILPSAVRVVLYSFDGTNETELVLPICPDNFRKDQINYYWALLFECVFLFITSTIGIAYYSMCILIIQHICALFNIVASKIEKKFKNNPHKFNHASNHSKFAQEYKWLIDIIECYDKAIDFADLMKLYLENIYPFEVFLTLLSIIVNYIYLFQLLSYTTNTNEGLQKCIYIIGSMFVIYIYNYLGQKLIDYHTEIYIKLCQIPFYSLSLKIQKMLLFFIMKSTVPCNLSIRGIIVLCHHNFASLMRTSFSFATMFYNLI